MSTMLSKPPTLAELNAKVMHNLAPPDDATATGETFVDTAGNRFPVYRERKEEAVIRERRDPVTQEVIWHIKDGHRQRPMKERVVTGVVEREYVLVPVGNGVVQKNYHFRPSAEELERRERQAAEANALSELSQFLKESGKGFGDLVGALKSAAKPKAGKPAAAE